MKVLAARVERDEDDLRLLYELCGFRSVEEALDHVESINPHQPMWSSPSASMCERNFWRRRLGAGQVGFRSCGGWRFDGTR